jgi:hypothetical protein
MRYSECYVGQLVESAFDGGLYKYRLVFRGQGGWYGVPTSDAATRHWIELSRPLDVPRVISIERCQPADPFTDWVKQVRIEAGVCE